MISARKFLESPREAGWSLNRLREWVRLVMVADRSASLTPSSDDRNPKSEVSDPIASTACDAISYQLWATYGRSTAPSRPTWKIPWLHDIRQAVTKVLFALTTTQQVSPLVRQWP